MGQSNYSKIPKEHNLVNSIYNDRENARSTLLPYGTSSFELILKSYDKNLLIPFYDLLEKIFYIRTSVLYQLYEIKPNRKIDKYHPSQILLNPWISIETFDNIKLFLEKNKDKTTSSLIKNFVKFIIKNIDKPFAKDYLLNWGFFLYYFDYPPYDINFETIKNWPIYYDNPYSKNLKDFMTQKIKQIQDSYKIDYSIFKTDNYYLTIPKNFYLYRIFKCDIYGHLENGMWAGINSSDIIGYLTPDFEYIDEKDEKYNNTLSSYCKELKKIVIFRTIKSLSLLNFSLPKTIQYVRSLIENQDKELLPIFDKSYSYKDENIIRSSIMEDDQKIATFLCKNNFDGYISFNTLLFHNEVMICKQTEVLDVEEICDQNDINLPFCNHPYIDYDLVIDIED